MLSIAEVQSPAKALESYPGTALAAHQSFNEAPQGEQGAGMRRYFVLASSARISSALVRSPCEWLILRKTTTPLPSRMNVEG